MFCRVSPNFLARMTNRLNDNKGMIMELENRATDRIHFDECDPAGIVFFGNYFKFAEHAFEKLLHKMGLSWKSMFNDPNYIFPVRMTSAEYFHPMYSGDEYQVNATIEKVGESSFTVNYSFKKDQLECCKLIIVNVCVEKSGQKKAPLPPLLKKSLLSHLGQ